MNEQNASINHYENFPVASWLCPAYLRPPIAAIYHFARTADDIADEGEQTAQQRLDLLRRYRSDLEWVFGSIDSYYSGNWPEVFIPLHRQVRAFDLPQQLLSDLLSAFEQDVEMTADSKEYQTHAQVLHYCTRSANPVGRLLLHLYGVSDATAKAHSDAICTALQLINFWQDLSVDIPRGRYYFAREVREQFVIDRMDVYGQQDSQRMRSLVQNLMIQARSLMNNGRLLPKTVGGKAGWELRFVMQGALRLADKIGNMDYASIQKRPRLYWWDMPIIAWRVLVMRLVYG